MKTRAYVVFGALVLALLGWGEYTGWVLSAATEAREVPKTVRDNPGSIRGHYGARPYTGAK